MSGVFDLDDDALLKELEIDIAEKEPMSESVLNERLESDFEEILAFYKANHRAPRHAVHYGIFERLMAVRLEKMQKTAEWHLLLNKLDTVGLLTNSQMEQNKVTEVENLNNDELLAELGMLEVADITTLRYVRSAQERKAAEDVGQQIPCVDFETFQPIFSAIAHDLQIGTRIAEPFKESIGIQANDTFILNGQFIYVAEVGEIFITKDNGESARLRVIYENATQSNILMHSLVRALYKDKSGRRISSINTDMPLFSNTLEEGDMASGTIYVLRSQSSAAPIAQHRELIHKIGVTGGSVEKRIANAVNEATYLLAEVEVVQTYQLHNINPIKLENLLHRVFQAARLNVELPDRFGKSFKPQEWFLVPLHAIDEAVKRIQNGSITHVAYDTQLAKFVEIHHAS